MLFTMDCANHYSEKNTFYRAGQGALRIILWNQGGGGPENLGIIGL
jgi:hypothetical protein